MTINIRQLLDAGVHFGHQTRFWNPKMAPFIFGSRNKIHIIDLDKTNVLLREALNYICKLSMNNGIILFVGTKRQAREAIANAAQRANMPYVDNRWLGGMLTNFKTLKTSIKRLKDMDKTIEVENLEKMNKKEALLFKRSYNKLERAIGGVKNMLCIPDAIFVVDVGYHKNTIAEAHKLNIPIVGVVDTNHSPDKIKYVIPGNDDSKNAVELYTNAIADAVIEGRSIAAAHNESIQKNDNNTKNENQSNKS